MRGCRPPRAGILGKSSIEAFQRTPAAEALRQRLEDGGALSISGANPAAHPFLTAVLRRWFPERPLLIVTEGLKKQEIFLQDLETWARLEDAEAKLNFYPAWEVLPHETRLPHADVIAER